MSWDDAFAATGADEAGPDYRNPMARLALQLNDRDNGVRLAAALDGELIWVPGKGFAAWNGKHYDFEAGAEEALGRAAILQSLVEEEAAAADRKPVSAEAVAAKAVAEGLDPETAEKKIRAGRKAKYRQYAVGCGNAGRMKAALEMARPRLRRGLDALDADRGVLQVANGTLDLEALAEEAPAGEEPEERLARMGAALGPHNRAGCPTRVAGARFDPGATCPEFERFLALAMPDLPDRLYLQRCMGALLGGQRSEMAFILLGEGGNGKSTLVRAVEAVLGGYAQPCRIEMFCETRVSGTGPTPEEAVLPGARVYLASEPDTTVTLSASKIKGLTGGDARQANPKNKDVFTYRPVGVPVLQANRMPNVNDPSRGFWRRINPILFMEDLTALPDDQRRDSEAVHRALAAELSGILNWLLAGWSDFRWMGLMPPASVRELKGSLRALADPVGEFLDEVCEEGPGLRVRTSDLHRAFVSWSEKQGNKSMGNRGFSGQMLARSWERTKVEGHWYWRGIGLTAEGLGLAEGGA